MKVTRMRVRRMQLGLTQARLAEVIGVTQPRISAWETGAADLPPKRREQLARELWIDGDRLLDEV